MNIFPHKLNSFRQVLTHRFLLFLLVLCIGTGCTIGITKIVLAQTPKAPPLLDITVSPPLIDLAAFPGDKFQKTVRIRNNTDQPLSLTITPKKLSSGSQGGQPIPAEPGPTDSYISWVTFDQPSFTAAPKEWTDIKFTLNVPQDAAFGYYYVFSIAEKNQEAVAKKSGVTIHSEVLIVMLLNVKKDGAKLSASLVELKPESFINQFLPVTFQTIIHNTGNVHVRPQGNIFVRGNGKSDLAILDVNRVNGAILPGGTRTFTSTWTDGFLVNEPVIIDGAPKLDTKGKPVTHLVVNWNKITSFRFGHYTASELLVYDDGVRDQTIEGTTSFWVIPYVFIAILLGVLIIFLIMIRLLFKVSVNKALRNSRK